MYSKRMTALETMEPAAFEMRLDQELEKQKLCDEATATLSDTSRSASDTSRSASKTSASGKGASPERSSTSEGQDPTVKRVDLSSAMHSQPLPLVKRHMVRSKRENTEVFVFLDETTLDGAEELDSNSIAEDYATSGNLKPPEFIEKIWKSCTAGFCNFDLNADEIHEDSDETNDEATWVENDDTRNEHAPFNIPSKVPSSMKKTHKRSPKKSIAANLPELVEELIPCCALKMDRFNSIPSTIFITSEHWEEELSIISTPTSVVWEEDECCS
jgi:hypothetical protein